ncbi:dienelactone hydrolase family protein [Pyxidicoccus parkwayensis]|uniref:Dienelactone hydrolase family protein n=1 Tax=Pyxidicoccus parkwayensis TaxID=2813578 RepID=A0ABX7PBQ4_9BACT|nr:alpha/beta fold hydrolase [Pyxidicoccus parkwaysis]QSQ27852.1 dienelactone hydrolase family protein [Pyxidicoccus parkwaysis]
MSALGHGALRSSLLALALLAGCGTNRPAPSRPPLVAPAPARTAPALWGPLAPGNHDVGLRVMAVPPGKDAADSRPLQLTVWYPARGVASTSRLHYRDYVGLTGSEQQPESSEDADVSRAAVTRYQKLVTDMGLPTTAVSAWLNADVLAARGAAPAPGRFPLVLVAQGRFHSAHHQAVLAEYLASHGYIVATTPFPAHLAPPSENEDVLAIARGQARDIARALDAIKADTHVDASRIALVGHSFGARSALLFAREHPETSALVSLDGGIANRQGKEWLAGLTGFRPEDFRVPLLHLYQQGDATVVPDFDLVRSLHGADRWLVRITGLRHFDFTSIGAATTVAPELAPGGKATSTSRGWAASANDTLRFLNAQLRQQTQELDSLTTLTDSSSSTSPVVTVTHWRPGQP